MTSGLGRAAAAVSLVEAGDVRAAKRALRAALAELDLPLQRLPSWVVVGVLVEWVGEGPRTVYRVTEVRRGRSWSFTGEKLRPSSAPPASGTYTIHFRQERGPRYWRKYRRRQLTLFSDLAVTEEGVVVETSR